MENLILDKPFLTFEQQITKLINEKNLTISNRNYALEVLSSISYFDLINGYKNLYQTNNQFISGMTIEQLFTTHVLNKNIQGAIIKYASYVENSFKTILSYVIAQNISEIETVYLDPHKYRRARNIIERQNFTRTLNEISDFCNNTTETPTSHYRDTKDHIPPWILFKNISFSSATDIYKALKKEDKEKLFTYFRLMSFSGLDYNKLSAIMPTALRIARKFRNKAAHNLNFMDYRLPLNNNVNIIFSGTLLHSDEMDKTFNDIWALILSIILLLNNRYIEYSFLSEISSYLQSYGKDMETLYCNITGIPIDYLERFKLYIDTLKIENNVTAPESDKKSFDNSYSEVAATLEITDKDFILKYNYKKQRKRSNVKTWRKRNNIKR